MKQFFLVLILSTPLIGLPEQGVIASRSDPNIVEWGHTLPYAMWTNATSWSIGNCVSNRLLDFSPARMDVQLVDFPAITFDGTLDTLVFSSIPSDVRINSYSGTAVLTLNAGTNEITATAGTCWDLILTNISGTWAHLPLQEGSGVIGYDISNNTNNTTLVANGSSITTMRSGSQSESHVFAENGGNKVLEFDGVGAYATCSTVSEITEYPFYLRTRIRFTGTGAKRACVALTEFNQPNTKQFYIGTSEGKLCIVARNPIEEYMESSLLYNDNSWHCVEGRFLASGNRELWVGDTWTNLIMVASCAHEDYVLFFPPSEISLGVTYTASTNQFYNGELVEASVYKDLSGVSVIDYHASEAYLGVSETLLIADNAGTNTLICTNIKEHYIPSRTGELFDVTGLAIKSPRRSGYNTGIYKLQQANVNTNLHSNPFWSDGTNMLKKTTANLLNHINFEDAVFVRKSPARDRIEVLTQTIDREYTVAEYNNCVAWLEEWDGVSSYLIPLLNVEGVYVLSTNGSLLLCAKTNTLSETYTIEEVNKILHDLAVEYERLP